MVKQVEYRGHCFHKTVAYNKNQYVHRIRTVLSIQQHLTMML